MGKWVYREPHSGAKVDRSMNVTPPPLAQLGVPSIIWRDIQASASEMMPQFVTLETSIQQLQTRNVGDMAWWATNDDDEPTRSKRIESMRYEINELVDCLRDETTCRLKPYHVRVHSLRYADGRPILGLQFLCDVTPYSVDIRFNPTRQTWNQSRDCVPAKLHALGLPLAMWKDLMDDCRLAVYRQSLWKQQERRNKSSTHSIRTLRSAAHHTFDKLVSNVIASMTSFHVRVTVLADDTSNTDRLDWRFAGFRFHAPRDNMVNATQQYCREKEIPSAVVVEVLPM